MRGSSAIEPPRPAGLPGQRPVAQHRPPVRGVQQVHAEALRTERPERLLAEERTHVVEQDGALSDGVNAVLRQVRVGLEGDAVSRAEDGGVGDRLERVADAQEAGVVDGQAARPQQPRRRRLGGPQHRVERHAVAAVQQQQRPFPAADHTRVHPTGDAALLERLLEGPRGAAGVLRQQAGVALEQRQAKVGMAAQALVYGQRQLAAAGAAADHDQMKRLGGALEFLVQPVEFAQQLP
jgi:hypothetical protein